MRTACEERKVLSSIARSAIHCDTSARALSQHLRVLSPLDLVYPRLPPLGPRLLTVLKASTMS